MYPCAFLQTLKAAVIRRAKATPKATTIGGVGNMSQQELSPAAMQWCMTKTLGLEKMFENFVGTGNLPSKSGLGLMQNKGLSIMAENINRFLYRFRLTASNSSATTLSVTTVTFLS